MRNLYGAIEGGGSKFRCAVGRFDSAGSPVFEIVQHTWITTVDPDQTLAQVRNFFSACQPLHGLGVACFGPMRVDRNAADFGCILDTPKTAWQGVDLIAALGDLAPSVTLQTDVHAAALAEHHLGHQPQVDLCTYITVGTGIGAGTLFQGRPLNQQQHAEFGHLFVPRHPEDLFAGVCPAHGHCLEGLASAPAMLERWGRDPSVIEDELPWQIEAYYLAQGCVTLLRSLAPQRIVFGGGLMLRESLLSEVQLACERLLGGYYAPTAARLQEIIVAARLGQDAGLLGAALLARSAAAA